MNVKEMVEWLNKGSLTREDVQELPVLVLAATAHEIGHGDLFATPAGNPESKPKEDDEDLIGRLEAAKLLDVTPDWFKGRKLPFKRRLGHRTVRFSRKGLLRWKEAQVNKR
jgi:hypothetical protein